MSAKVTKKSLEEALETYASLVEMYPDNEAYLQRYADMLQTLGREATAIITLQHLHDIIAKRSPKEATAFASKHPEIGRILLDDIAFEDHDKHAIAGKIIYELLGSIWLRLHQKKLRESQAICHTNDLHDSLILILEGSADAYAVNTENERILVEHVGEMDILGEHTFFKPNKMNIDVFVSSKTATIVEIPRKKLLAMVASNHHLEKMLSQRSLFRTNVHILAKNDAFQTMPLKLTKYLARKLTLKHYKRNMLIHNLKEPSLGIDIVVTGQVCYITHNSNKEKVILSPLPPLSIIGDTALKGGPTTAMAALMAKTTATLAHVAYQDLLSVSVAYPPLKERLIQHSDNQKVRIMQEISKN